MRISVMFLKTARSRPGYDTASIRHRSTSVTPTNSNFFDLAVKKGRLNTMITRTLIILALTMSVVAACSKAPEPESAADTMTENDNGLIIRKLKNGHGRAAVPGDFVTVHYTGWLYDESAADNRGTKFDSSVDRGQKFQFPLGAGRVIRGWDEGVAGMLIGEKRELTIPPDMAYGDRGAGDAIPPGSTLVFEVELFGAKSPLE